MKIQSFQGGYDKNFTYVVWCPETKLSAIIDPSTEINPISEYIENNDLILSKILITHTHYDHIAYLNDFLDIFQNITVHCYHKPLHMKNDFIGLDTKYTVVSGESIKRTYLDSSASTLMMGVAYRASYEFLQHYSNTQLMMHLDTETIVQTIMKLK